jgi:hypothetical protein
MAGEKEEEELNRKERESLFFLGENGRRRTTEVGIVMERIAISLWFFFPAPKNKGTKVKLSDFLTDECEST